MTDDPARDDAAAVAAHLGAVTPERLRADARALDRLFRDVTGWRPRLWGTMVGYGSYHYTYATGREGDYFATGFAAACLVVGLAMSREWTASGDTSAPGGAAKSSCCGWKSPGRQPALKAAMVRDSVSAGRSSFSASSGMLPAETGG